ncbi:RiPP maturation radical SAM C-methyltransferase [Nannocystis punicea]|uniref:RiPP maturation radical SAM C-methyltransferase n=1 Tax=Nannocystis punicea TaxID=2995304 RepID=A0ABY7H113_9BACT|nr:RiPP maturation radical SAM C-methyltransferase [Nannocystis poenicansa]WAS92937.1 RiPP maturation radical SAM C-methyltransferase [Nannocystis poenicansa]
MKVLFAVMPFGALRPAIGPSLLKAHLARRGIASKIVYLNIRFARSIGLPDYEYVAERSPSQSLAGDWIFARSLSGERPDADARYLADFVRRFSKFGPVDRAIEILERCRDRAAGFLQKCLREVSWGDYDVVGFTSTFSQHAASLALARLVKAEHPRVKIALGGANCEESMGLQAHRSFPFIDFVCSAEADLSFPRLLEALAAGGDPSAVPGVIARRDGESRYTTLTPDRVERMDDLPVPLYDDYFEQLPALGGVAKRGASVLMESSRGCWWGQKHHCTFCGLNGTSMAFRSKSEQRVLREIDELEQLYGARTVVMVDNILDMKYFETLIPGLARRGLKLDLFYETKANLSKDQLRAMQRAGITMIQPGIESLSSDVLRIMKKGISGVQNVQMLKWCREFGITPHWNLIFGFPGEEPRDYEVMAEVLDLLHHLQPPYGVGQIRLDRFSPNFVRSSENGLTNVRPDRSYGNIYALSESELFEFAYYFEHDYADGRDPETYVGPLRAAVKRWYANKGNKGLLYVDHGDDLAVWDFRPGAHRTLTVLSGLERAVYVCCDQHRSLKQVVAACRADEREVRPVLDGLVASRLVLHLDDRYLSLAVRKHGVGRDEDAEPRAPSSRSLAVV